MFILLLTGLATLAALTRPVATPVDALPGVAAAVTGVAVLLGLLTALRGRRPVTGRRAARAARPRRTPTAHDGRRTFLLGAGAVTLGAAGAATFGQRLASTGGPASITLPAPAMAARPLPPGLERTVRGISPLRTGNATFYRVDTNLTVPQVDVDRWTARDRRDGGAAVHADLRRARWRCR